MFIFLNMPDIKTILFVSCENIYTLILIFPFEFFYQYLNAIPNKIQNFMLYGYTI